MNKALITGISGMDGSILAELLISQGWNVYGLVRKINSPNHWRINHLLNHPLLRLFEGDVTSLESVHQAVEKSQPDMVFNLAAHSFVPHSWAEPVNTFQVSAVGVMNILESIRNINRSIRFYQASSSEMFGKAKNGPQNEETPFYPYSPYGVAKVAAHYATINYREIFNIHATSGILYNHEHERRGDQFVTRKITKGVAQFFVNKLKKMPCHPIRLGNLDAQRDWGYAEDYVKAMIKIINHPIPDNFVVATGITRTVREWCGATVYAAIKCLGLPYENIVWKGSGMDEQGFINDELLFVVAKEFYRPAEDNVLCGNSLKAQQKLGWQIETTFEKMVERMVYSDISINLSTRNSI